MSNDTMLQQAVLAELSWEPSVTAGHIGVTADHGVVTLSGHVQTYAEKRAAETAAGRVKGVKAVAENIVVQLPFSMKRTDDQIAATVLDRFTWDVGIPKDKLKVKVEEGNVTLTGEVDWHFQSEAAEDACRRLWGVVAVFNQIRIKPQVRPAEIQDKIKTALHRVWYEPQVTVSADGGKVQLSGTVRNWQERRQAETVAWGAPGVTQVDDSITINFI